MTGSTQLAPLAEADFAVLARLAGVIWRGHYGSMISMAQVEYMLAGRYTPENLRRYVNAADRGLALLRVDGAAVGYCSYARTPESGRMKLEQLYLLREHRGLGLGARMLRHVEEQARAAACTRLCLTVNKHNAGAIAFYRAAGFAVREEVTVDIGNGYVMDDYVMEKPL